MAYERAASDDRRLVIVNFGDREAAVPVREGPWRVEVSSDGRAEEEAYEGVVPGPGAVVLNAAGA